MSTIIDTLLSLNEQLARDTLLVQHQDLPPTWVIIDGHNKPHIHKTPWADDHEKRLAEVLIRAIVRASKAQAYSFLTEAWMAVAPKNWDPDKEPLAQKDRPMNRADREEVVLAFATDGTQREWRQWAIRRNWNEQIITLEPKEMRGSQPEGWMAEMLSKK